MSAKVVQTWRVTWRKTDPTPKRKKEQDNATAFTGSNAVHFEATDPGTAWNKDAWIAIDLDSPLDSERILTPNVIRLPGGGYRLYYTGLGPARTAPDCIGYILSASSRDAVTWVKDPGVRVDVFPPHAALWTLCPDVIPLPDGRYRMYFEARSPDQPTVILSAVSDDGLAFTVEPGIRVGDGRWSYGTPRCLYIEPAAEGASAPRYRLYHHKYTFPLVSGLDAGNEIISAVSADGLHFERAGRPSRASASPRRRPARRCRSTRRR